MNDKAVIRDYKDSDKESVLSLFKLNTPAYFSSEEKNDLIEYLENEIEQYFVLELNRQIVGCGGFNFSKDKSIGVISWDIFHPEFQRRSLGSSLLNYRIKKLQQFKTIRQIIVRTSQLSYKFYEKLGFELMEIENDYWAKDYHLYKMEYTGLRT